MLKLFLPLLLLLPLILWGCSNDLSQRVYDLEHTQNMLVERMEVAEINQIRADERDMPEGEDVDIQPDNDTYCHKRNDIKIWDNVYYPFLGNQSSIENYKIVKVDWIEIYYEIQTVYKIQRELVNGKDCITMINWYWVNPQKSFEDMVERIKNYFKYTN